MRGQVMLREGLQTRRGRVAGCHCAKVVQPMMGVKLQAVGVVITDDMAIRSVTISGPACLRVLRLQVGRDVASKLGQQGVTSDYPLSPWDRNVKKGGWLLSERKAVVAQGACRRD